MPTNKIFGDANSRTVDVDGELLDPKESQSFQNHSPDGFAWGYHGSGPSQLALALMIVACDKLGEAKHTALQYYQAFKVAYVAKWKGDFRVEVDLAGWLSKEINSRKLTEDRYNGKDKGG
jgi:hypothetical protein